MQMPVNWNSWDRIPPKLLADDRKKWTKWNCAPYINFGKIVDIFQHGSVPYLAVNIAVPTSTCYLGHLRSYEVTMTDQKLYIHHLSFFMSHVLICMLFYIKIKVYDVSLHMPAQVIIHSQSDQKKTLYHLNSECYCIHVMIIIL